MAENDIPAAAYGPLAPLMGKPDGPVTAVVESIAKKRDRTPAQVDSSCSILT